MMHPNTFEQLRVFREVALAGSFSEAAQTLGKAVSAVTYAIGNLEAQFELELFDRNGYRPVLTAAGKTLYQDTLVLFRRLDRFQARVDNLKQQDVAVLTIGHDLHIPAPILATAVSRLHREYPQVDMRLRRLRTFEMEEVMERAEVDVAIVALYDTMTSNNLDGQQIGACDTIIVAAPDHPLTELDSFQIADLDRYRQLILNDEIPEPGDENYTIHSTDYWVTDNADVFINLLLQGQAWAWANRNLVSPMLDKGALVELKTPAVVEANRRRFAALWPIRRPGGRTVRRFIELMGGAFRETESSVPL